MSRSLLSTMTTFSLLLAGCADTAVGDTQLLVPTELEFSWDEELNGEDDGLVSAVPVDLMVYDAATGVPVAGTDIELSVIGASLALEGDLFWYDDDCAGCLFDDRRGRFLEIPAAGFTEGLQVSTDGEGFVRVFVVVDALEWMGDDYEPVSLRAVDAHSQQDCLLLPR